MALPSLRLILRQPEKRPGWRICSGLSEDRNCITWNLLSRVLGGTLREGFIRVDR
jgi:hypothetical protein